MTIDQTVSGLSSRKRPSILDAQEPSKVEKQAITMPPRSRCELAAKIIG